MEIDPGDGEGVFRCFFILNISTNMMMMLSSSSFSTIMITNMMMMLSRVKYERAMADLEFAKRRLLEQHEEDLEQTMVLKKQMEKKVGPILMMLITSMMVLTMMIIMVTMIRQAFCLTMMRQAAQIPSSSIVSNDDFIQVQHSKVIIGT